MGKICKVTGVIFNILSHILLAMALIPSNWGNGGGVSPGFAFWAYSVICALISTAAYSIGAFRKLKSGGSVIQLLFSIGMLVLCVCIGGSFNSTYMIVWNVAFAINLILQIRWLRN